MMNQEYKDESKTDSNTNLCKTTTLTPHSPLFFIYSLFFCYVFALLALRHTKATVESVELVELVEQHAIDDNVKSLDH